MADERPRPRFRVAYLAAAIAVAVAAAGFVTGTRRAGHGAAPPVRGPASDTTSEAPVPPYGDLGAARRGKNAGMYEQAFVALGDQLPAPTDEVIHEDGDLAAALAARDTNRAFEGAPPTIPHPIIQLGPPNCLVCHERGAVVAGDRIARAMSHQRYDHCFQCHVVAHDPRRFGDDPPAPESSFVGLGSSGPGKRATPETAPTNPHGTWMRENCLSCHGVAGADGLRTTHPTKTNCRECHQEPTP